MNELYVLRSILNRNISKKFAKFYKENNISVAFIMHGRGTAANEMLDYLGLEASEKVVTLAVVTKDCWKTIKRGLQNQMKIDVPGTGVVFTIPMSSIGGKRPLLLLTDNLNFQKGEESTLKDTKYELLMAIANQGYTSMIMDAARDVGASGGTVLHAKGTGMERAEQLIGVSLVAEKEIVLIVVKRTEEHDYESNHDSCWCGQQSRNHYVFAACHQYCRYATDGGGRRTIRWITADLWKQHDVGLWYEETPPNLLSGIRVLRCLQIIPLPIRHIRQIDIFQIERNIVAF